MNEAILVLGRAGIQGGIALIVVYVVCRVLHRLSPDLRCWLWRAAYIKCLAGLFVAVSVAVPILPRAVPEEPSVALSPQNPGREPAFLTDFEKGETLARASVELVTEGYPPVHPEAAVVAATAVPAASTDTVPSPVVTRPTWRFYLLLLYALGVSVATIRLTLAALRTRRLVRRAIPVEHPALPELSRRFGMSVIPRLARSSETESPLLAFGTILLPADTTGDESLMLAHELAHLRRNDLAWEWLGIVTQIVFWFHPLVPLARSEERLVREQAADALTLSRTAAPPVEYARLLLEASLRRSGRVPALAVGAVEGGSHLRQRLNALAAPVLTRRRAFALGVVAVILATIAFVPWRAVARRETPKTPAVAQTVAQKDRMAGVVLDTEGNPVAGAPVSWVTLMRKQTEILATVTTDKAGRFEFDPSLGVRFKVKNSSEWYYTGNGWIMARVPGYGLTVERVREPNPTVTLRLAGEQNYSVALRDTKNRPLIGEAVSVDSYNDGHSHFPVKWLGYKGTTDANGEYRVTGLPAVKTPWFDWDRSKYALYRYSTLGTRTTLTLGSRRSLVGTVFAPDGKPAREKLTVDVHQKNAPSVPTERKGVWTECDSQGRYRVDGLAAGGYRVGIFRWVGKDLMMTDSCDITIPPTAPVVRADIRLKPLSASNFFRSVDSYGLPSGVVTDRAGKPVPGAEVSWVVSALQRSWIFPSPKKQEVLAAVRTDKTGKFVFRTAPGVPGDAAVTGRFRREHGSDVLMVRARGYGLGASPVRFRKGGNYVTLDPPRDHTVTLRDANGKPVVGLPVWIDALSDDSPWTFVRLKWFGYAGKTDASGAFRVAGLPQSRSIRWGFDDYRYSILRLERYPNRTVITLGNGRTVEGTIRLPDGTPAKKQILVRAVATLPSLAPSDRTVSTDERGRYRLTGLGTGLHHISADIYGDQSLHGSPTMEIDMPPSGGILRRDLTLQRAGKIVGRVTDRDGKPMVHVTVTNRRGIQETDGYSSGGGVADAYASTDKDGNYEMDVPVGEARVSVEWGDARTVLVRADDPARLDFVVSRRSIPTITGRVLDGAGKPVVWNNVVIQHRRTEYRTSTDGKGYFEWRHRVEDDSPITVFVKRGTEGAIAAVTPGDEKPLMLRLSKDTVGYLAGQVTDATGTPIASPILQLLLGDQYYHGDRLRVDAMGRFLVAVRPDTPYRVVLRAPGTAPQPASFPYNARKGVLGAAIRESVTVGTGKIKDLGRIVLAPDNDTATGVLLDAQQKPVARARFLLHTPSGGKFGDTDDAGRFVVPGVLANQPGTLFVFETDSSRPRSWTKRGLTVGEMGAITLTDAVPR